MDLFVWDDSYSVGIDTFDREHKQLVKILNELHSAMQSGQSQTVLRKVLDELLRYTATHFAHEERVMEACKYSKLDLHKRQHANLTAQVEEYMAEVNSGRSLISVKLMRFLKEWLSSHILGDDKLYTAELKDKA